MLEANKAARELKLQETLPITRSNVVDVYISKPRMAQATGGIGSISTSNYTYSVSIGGKLSFVYIWRFDSDRLELEKNYQWPLSLIDTNAAFRLATQWLAAASMDVARLNRDCVISVWPRITDRPGYFVPVYRVAWAKQEEPVANVELFLPTKTLRDLRVNRLEYILRSGIEFTNLEELLSETNTPTREESRKE